MAELLKIFFFSMGLNMSGLNFTLDASLPNDVFVLDFYRQSKHITFPLNEIPVKSATEYSMLSLGWFHTEPISPDEPEYGSYGFGILLVNQAVNVGDHISYERHGGYGPAFFVKLLTSKNHDTGLRLALSSVWIPSRDRAISQISLQYTFSLLDPEVE